MALMVKSRRARSSRRLFKVHPVRTPVIPVSPFGAKGGDLNGLPAGHNGDGAVLLSGADQGKSSNTWAISLAGRRYTSPSRGGQPQQPVLHTAAHGPGFKAPVLQPFHIRNHGTKHGKSQDILGNCAGQYGIFKRPAAKRNESELVSLCSRYGVTASGHGVCRF